MELETIKRKKSEVFPAVRFKEFEENWTINKIGSFVKERSVIAQDELPLYSLTIENGVVPKSKRYERSFLVKGKADAYKMMIPGDFAFNPMNLRFGALAMYKGKREIAVSKYYNIFYCIGNSNSAFMEYYLTRYNMIQYYNKMSTGTLEEKKRVHYSDFVNFRKLFPSLPEQQKIANFLSTVDKKIQQLVRKKELLENYKKGMMQKLFAQEIRFQDENGKDFPEWEKKPIGQILKIGSGKDYKHLNPGNIPVFGTGGIMTYVDDNLYEGASVGIGRKGTIDKPVFLTGKFWTVDTLFYTHSFNQVIPKFVYSIFQQINWRKHNEASGVPSLSKNTIEKLKVKIPSIEEQQKIADFLSAIDKKIEAVSNQIEKTQTFKKGLLQQMFV